VAKIDRNLATPFRNATPSGAINLKLQVL